MVPGLDTGSVLPDDPPGRLMGQRSSTKSDTTNHQHTPSSAKLSGSNRRHQRTILQDILPPLCFIVLAICTSYQCRCHWNILVKHSRHVAEKFVLSWWRDAPPGHLQKLGAHRPPETDGIDVLYDFPHPVEFFNNYVHPLRPVVFKGLAKLHPAYELWTDEYLREHFGSKPVQVELQKKEDRTREIDSVNMSQFLTQYTEKEYYIVDDIEEEMLNDVVMPRSVQCGGFQEVMSDAVLWFSSGGTSSVLHCDALDNINCVLDGSKQLFLVDIDDSDHIDFDHMEDLYSGVDVDRVDMYKYPGLRDVPWYNVTLERGDCFYIPYKWPHQVVSSRSRNMAVNLWFVHLYWLNGTDCQLKPHLPSAANMLDFDLNDKAQIQKADLIGKTQGQSPLTVLAFADLYSADLAEGGAEVADQAFTLLDRDGDGLLTLEEMHGTDTSRFLRLFPRYDPPEFGY